MAAAAIAPTKVRAQAAPSNRRLIDVHHHFSPPVYVEASLRARGRPSIKWSLAATLEEMDKNSIATAVLSLILPGVWFGKVDEESRVLARACNEYAANLVREHPGRFGSFAAIPLMDTEGSLREIEYSLDVLKADGIALWSSYGGKYLGDPAFLPIFEELNRRKAVVYTHPTPTERDTGVFKGVPESTIEYTHDTTRTIGSLVFGEAKTAMKCPDVNFIWPHSGGTLPFLALRMSELAAQRKEQFPEGVLPIFRRFYYDVAGNTRGQIAALLDIADVSHLMFGSDFPYARAADVIRHFDESKLSDADKRGIERENAIKLMPRLGV